MEESSNNDSNSNTGIDRVQLKEERRIRNKQKKLAKQLESQRKREQANLLKLQPKSNYLTLLTQDDAKRIVGNIPLRSSNHEFSVSERDFPSLEETGRINVHKSGSNQVVHLEPSGKSLAKINVELADLLNRPSALTIPHKSVPVRCTSTASYGGNSLDSDMPVRSRGKVREEPKEKKPTLLKQKILQDKSENVDLKENPFESNLPYEFEESTKVFIKNLVELQQKLYKRNPIKGAYKKRYVVGLHEVKKCLQLNRVKILFFATDIQITKENGMHRFIRFQKVKNNIFRYPELCD